MLAKNVHYSERPDRIIITTIGSKAVIEMPVDIKEVETEEGTDYVCNVYSVTTKATSNLAERVERNYDKWIEIASKPELQKVDLADVIEAINVLTDMVLGG